MQLLGTFLIAAMAGLALDHIHVHWHVLAYANPHPGAFGQPWWVAPEFGLAALVLLATAPIVIGGRSPTDDRSRRRFALDMCWFIGAYAATGLAADHPRALTASLAAALVARLATHRPTARELVFIASLAVAGPACEAAISATGAFRYLRPDLLGIPMWLPLLYAHGAPAAIDVAASTRGSRQRPTDSTTPTSPQ